MKSDENRKGRPTSYQVKKREECLKIIRKHAKSFGGSLSDDEVRKLCGSGILARNTYYKYKRYIRGGMDSE